MLITKPPASGDIIAMKLITGEEVIAKLKTDNGTALVVSKPIAVGMSPQGVGFMPFMISADEDAEMVFPSSMVVTHVVVRKELKDAYIQNTSGIVPANGPLPSGLVSG